MIQDFSVNRFFDKQLHKYQSIYIKIYKRTHFIVKTVISKVSWQVFSVRCFLNLATNIRKMAALCWTWFWSTSKCCRNFATWVTRLKCDSTFRLLTTCQDCDGIPVFLMDFCAFLHHYRFEHGQGQPNLLPALKVGSNQSYNTDSSR